MTGSRERSKYGSHTVNYFERKFAKKLDIGLNPILHSIANSTEMCLSLFSCRVTLRPVKMKLQLSEIMTGCCSASVNTLTTLCCMGKRFK